MSRAIFAVVAGYFAMIVWIMVTVTIAWKTLGPAFAFKEGTTEVTVGWLAVNLPLSLLGAVLGGWVAAFVGRSPTGGPVKALAVLILVLGLATGVAHLYVDPAPEDREAAAAEEKPVTEMSGFQASSEAIQPTWYNFVIGPLGFAGVWLGGTLQRRRKAATAD